MAASAAVLVVRNVTKRFGGLAALAGVDFEVGAGEFVGLIGPNGSGKSTLVNVITRMIIHDSGSVTVDGSDLGCVPPHLVVDHGVARTFQHVRLTAELTIQENVAIGGLFRHQRGMGSLARLLFAARATRRAAMARTESALDLMEIASADRAKLPKEVPFAVQRRTELARALVASPKLLLLDEPAAGMNPVEVRYLGKLLTRASGELGLATVLIDHNMDFVMRMVRRITVINRGVRIAIGTAEEIRNDPAVVEAYLGARSARMLPVAHEAPAE